MKNDNETTRLKHRVDRLFEDLSVFNRTLLILKLFSWVIVYYVSKFRRQTFRPRAHIHWVGNHRKRRPERYLFFLLFMIGAVSLKPDDLVYWSTFIGGITAIFLNLYAAYRFIPRKRAHYLR